MAITIYIAIYGAVISTIALGWNIYKQATSGPKLVGSVVPVLNEFVAPLRGAKACFDLVVNDRGTGETKITNVVVLCYKNRLDRYRKKYTKQATIAQSPTNYELPYPISPGHEFRCRLDMDAELLGWTRCYRTYLCVVHSMSDAPAHFRLKLPAVAPTQGAL